MMKVWEKHDNLNKKQKSEGKTQLMIALDVSVKDCRKWDNISCPPQSQEEDKI